MPNYRNSTAGTSSTTTVNANLWEVQLTDVVIAVEIAPYSSPAQRLSTVTGAGVDWTPLEGADSLNVRVWVPSAIPLSSGSTARVITGTGPAHTRRLEVWVISGTSGVIVPTVINTALGSGIAEIVAGTDTFVYGAAMGTTGYPSLSATGFYGSTFTVGGAGANIGYASSMPDDRHVFTLTEVPNTVVHGVVLVIGTPPILPARTGPFTRWRVTGTTATTGSTAQVAVPTVKAGDVVVVFDAGAYTDPSERLTELTGLGATWSLVPNASTPQTGVWVGHGATPAETTRAVTGTGPALGTGKVRQLIVYVLSNVAAAFTAWTYRQGQYGNPIYRDWPMISAGPGQVVLAVNVSDYQWTPSSNNFAQAQPWINDLWSVTGSTLGSTQWYVGHGSRVPAQATVGHKTAPYPGVTDGSSVLLVVGNPAPDPVPIPHYGSFVRHFTRGTPVRMSEGYAEATVPTTRSGDMVFVLEVGNYGKNHQHLQSMTGLGGTWRHVSEYFGRWDRDFHFFNGWICTNPVPSYSPRVVRGEDPTYEIGSINRALLVFVMHGVSRIGNHMIYQAQSAETTTSMGMNWNQTPVAGDIMLGAGFSNEAEDAITRVAPADWWNFSGPIDIYESRRWTEAAWRYPKTGDQQGSLTSYRDAGRTMALGMRFTGPPLPVDPNEPPPPAEGVAVFNGTTWLQHPLKVWDGTTWITRPVKTWTGTTWA